jgi:hypothetical protein
MIIYVEKPERNNNKKAAITNNYTRLQDTRLTHTSKFTHIPGMIMCNLKLETLPFTLAFLKIKQE